MYRNVSCPYESSCRFRYGDGANCTGSACFNVPSKTESPVVFTNSESTTVSLSVSARACRVETKNIPAAVSKIASAPPAKSSLLRGAPPVEATPPDARSAPCVAVGIAACDPGPPDGDAGNFPDEETSAAAAELAAVSRMPVPELCYSATGSPVNELGFEPYSVSRFNRTK